MWLKKAGYHTECKEPSKCGFMETVMLTATAKKTLGNS